MKHLMKFIFVAISAILFSSCGYNSMVEKEEAVNNGRGVM